MSMEHTPHDVFFRSFFSHTDTMQALLEHILPPETRQELDLHSLAIEPGTYLDKKGRNHYADLSASVKLSGNNMRIYILYEHKSWRDEKALLQLLRYKQMVWQKEKGLLTPILPVLFYHGPDGRFPDRFSQLFPADIPEKLLPRQVEFQAVLYNLSSVAEDRLTAEKNRELQAALLSLKYARDNMDLLIDQLYRLGKSGGIMFLTSTRFELIKLYLLYASSLTYDEIEQKIQERVIDPVMQEALMLSTAQMLKQEGRQEGRQETVYETADRMLDRDYPLQEIAELTGLPLEEVERLSREKHASDS
ncbi:Rpn family recombination-promoting nuclease/putative transposase [Spirochaeta dissipatitropha]